MALPSSRKTIKFFDRAPSKVEEKNPFFLQIISIHVHITSTFYYSSYSVLESWDQIYWSVELLIFPGTLAPYCPFASCLVLIRSLEHEVIYSAVSNSAIISWLTKSIGKYWLIFPLFVFPISSFTEKSIWDRYSNCPSRSPLYVHTQRITTPGFDASITSATWLHRYFPFY